MRQADSQTGTWTRRQVLAMGAAAIAGSTLNVSCTSDEGGSDVASNGKLLPIVDTHQHLWNLDELRLPWTETETLLKRNFLMADYLKAAEGLGIEKTIYMEVDVAPDLQVQEAEHVIGLVQDKTNPMVGAVISGRPDASDFTSYVDRFKDGSEVRGLRRILHPPELAAKHCLSKEFIAGVQYLGKVGWTFDVCIRPEELNDAASLCEACPDTQFVLDHCGNAKFQEDLTQWKRDIEALTKKENMVCKVSGFVAQASKETWTTDELAVVVNHVLDVFGMDRVVFGSDWPVCNLKADYKKWVTALREIIAKRPEADQRKLLYSNAHKVYGIA